MKTRFTQFIGIFILSISFFYFIGCVESGKNSFEISIELKVEGLKLLCSKGCAWKELMIEHKNDLPRAVNANGLTDLEDKSTAKKDENLSNFLFTITEKTDGIRLKGIKGTAWKELGFGIGSTDTIKVNYHGVSVN